MKLLAYPSIHARVWICLLCGLSFCSILAVPVFPAPSQDWRSSQEDLIRVSALKYQITGVPKKVAPSHNQVIFLAEAMPEGKNIDLSDTVMKAFVDLEYVKKFSQSRPGEKDGCPTDKETGERGSVIYVKRFHWKNDKNVDLDGGSYSVWPGNGSWTWHLSQEDDYWVIKSETLTGVG